MRKLSYQPEGTVFSVFGDEGYGWVGVLLEREAAEMLTAAPRVLEAAAKLVDTFEMYEYPKDDVYEAVMKLKAAIPEKEGGW